MLNTELQFWLFENKEFFKFKYNTEEKIFSGRTFYRSNWVTHLGNKSFVGHGMDLDSRLSLMKALSESLERTLTNELKITTTNGIAAHPDSIQANIFALSELIERDSFLGHWYSGTAPYFKEKTSTEYGEFEIYQLASSLESICVAMAVSRFKEGFVIGLGASDTWQRASGKAILELASVKIGLQIIEITPHSLEEFLNLKKYIPMDHIRWGLSQESSLHVEKWLKQKSQLSLEELSLRIKKVVPNLEELQWRFSSPPPYHFVRANSPEHLQLFFGIFIDNEDKMTSLKLWNDSGIINEIPHPFG